MERDAEGSAWRLRQPAMLHTGAAESLAGLLTDDEEVAARGVRRMVKECNDLL